MIHRVVIIDNKGNEVALTEAENPIAWRPRVITLDGNPSNETRDIMEQAIDKLTEVKEIDTDNN